MDNISDYFRVQKAWQRLMGVWLPINVSVPALHALTVGLRTLFQAFIFIVMSHLSVVFFVSFYVEAGTATFARISYCLSQTAIFAFAGFSVFYFYFQEPALQSLVDFVNSNFRFRSAKGVYSIIIILRRMQVFLILILHNFRPHVCDIATLVQSVLLVHDVVRFYLGIERTAMGILPILQGDPNAALGLVVSF